MRLRLAKGGTTVGVVGCSHMTALQLAARAGHGLADVRVGFRGLGGREFSAIHAGEKGVFVDRKALLMASRKRPTWGDVRSVMRYRDFDAFAVVGVLRTYQLLRTFLRAEGQTFSPGYVREGIDAIIAKDHGFALAADIARLSGRPVAVTVSPLPAVPREIEGDLERPYRKMVARLADAAAARGVIFAPQPEETLERFAWTKPAYAIGSMRLSGREHPVDERTHMNEAYGAIALPALLHAVTAREAAAAA